MNIPLIVRPTIDFYTGDQNLQLWVNGKSQYVKSPFKPYFYSLNKLNLSQEHAIETQVQKTIFSTLAPTNIYKYSFKNTKQFYNYRKEFGQGNCIESSLTFDDRIAIDEPDFFTQFPNTDLLKVMFFDIEVDTTGMFPTPERNAIIAIGAKCGDQKKIFMADTYSDDRIILNKFFDLIKETDPDIITHYNGNKFDIPYCMERMKINNIPLNRWSRDKSTPSIFNNALSIGGRVSFDLYNEAQRDQTIYGIKNLKMKTLARWIDKSKVLDIKEVPYSEMRSMINTPELKQYLISDVEITEFLFKVYYKNVQMLAEMNHVPLNMMVNASPSFLPNIIHGRKFKELNMVSDKINAARHPNYIKKKQGALVDTFAPGLYNHEIFKVDFASQYPRIVETFNASPETVKILRYDDFGEYKFDISDPKKYIFSIPDIRAEKNVVLEIDMSKVGFLTKFMNDTLNERFAIKKQMKVIKKDSSEYEYMNVRQNALKVICNVQTGYQGQAYALFGDLGCYNLITGMGRFFIMLAMEGIKEQSNDGN